MFHFLCFWLYKDPKLGLHILKWADLCGIHFKDICRAPAGALQISTLKSPMSTKLDKLEGLMLCTIERRES